MIVQAPDRRAALKARHRAAILDAARSLVTEKGGPRFGVDELAERADVARRTIFNHFASLDEILLTLCDDALEVIIDDFLAIAQATPVGDGSRAAMFDEVAQMLRTADLPAAIASIGGILGPLDPADTRGRALSDAAFARAGEKLVPEVSRRNPAADSLEAELLVSSLLGGVIVIAQRWVLKPQLRVDDESRAEWDDLLTRLIETVRTGYHH